MKFNSFQKKVYEVVRKIPKGRVLTYKIVAKLAGRPKAWRAVGNILNKNKDPKIPCHRVIKVNGEIGGYRYGIKKNCLIKKRMYNNRFPCQNYIPTYKINPVEEQALYGAGNSGIKTLL